MRSSLGFLIGIFLGLVGGSALSPELGIRMALATVYVAPGYTDNIDRPGGDYRNFVPASNDASWCRGACYGDARCRAWTFVRAGFQGASPRCWLKDSIRPAVRSNCCVSGVRGDLEVGIDRPGSDLRWQLMPTGGPDACRQACVAHSFCHSYTYVNAGVQGPQARCWFKRGHPAAVPNNCCTSGIVR